MLSFPAKLSQQTRAVIVQLLDAYPDGVHGYAIAAATSIPRPTVYGILRRLENLNWTDHVLQDTDEAHPPRRVHHLTDEGAETARALLGARPPRRLAA